MKHNCLLFPISTINFCFAMVVLDEEADADDDENKKVKKKSKEQRKEKTFKKRTNDR